MFSAFQWARRRFLRSRNSKIHRWPDCLSPNSGLIATQLLAALPLVLPAASGPRTKDSILTGQDLQLQRSHCCCAFSQLLTVRAASRLSGIQAHCMDTSPPAICNPVQFALYPYNRLWPSASMPKPIIPSSIMHQPSGLPQKAGESVIAPTYLAFKNNLSYCHREY